MNHTFHQGTYVKEREHFYHLEIQILQESNRAQKEWRALFLYTSSEGVSL